MKAVHLFLCLFSLYLVGSVVFVVFVLRNDEATQSAHLQKSGLKMVKLCVVIFSAANHTDRRKCIRSTWLSLQAKKVKHYFVLGVGNISDQQKKLVAEEKSQFLDVVTLPLQDKYEHLASKLLLSLSWLWRNVDCDFLLKVDDDSFARLNAIYAEISTTKIQNLYWGFFDGRAPVQKYGVWKEQNWILCDRYLPYALGGGYVVSRSVVNHVVNNADLLNLYRSEDVSLGVWTSPLNITRVHDIRFDTEFRSRGCLNHFLITHKKSIVEMELLFNTLVRTGHLCEKELVLRYPYDYKWSAMPSNCCRRDPLLIKMPNTRKSKEFMLL